MFFFKRRKDYPEVDLSKFPDGSIFFIRQKGFSLIGKLIRNAQRDFDFEHVCQLFGGQLYSTGVSGFPFYRFGIIKNPNKYLAGRHYAIAIYKGLTNEQVRSMFDCAKALVGRVYPWWKVIGLAAQGRVSSRMVEKLGPGKPNLNPKHVFCAGAVALGLVRAGIKPQEINPRYPKLEPDAFTVETLYDSPNLVFIHRSDDEKEDE